jgi:hypothetical protein
VTICTADQCVCTKTCTGANQGEAGYRDPHEFFKRTFITEGPRHLLTNALRRLSGEGGDPVVELKTNFGGGKRHSMIALYHLFSGLPAGSFDANLTSPMPSPKRPRPAPRRWSRQAFPPPTSRSAARAVARPWPD